MDRIIMIGGQAYLLNEAAMAKAAAWMPPLPLVETDPVKLTIPFAYHSPITAAALVKEDRTEDLLDLGRLIANGAELAQRKADAEKRAGN